ncbi:MAG: hypothetical protein AB1498_05175 [bacterium]
MLFEINGPGAKIGFDENKTQAFFYAERNRSIGVKNPKCKFVLFEKISGTWKLTATFPAWTM